MCPLVVVAGGVILRKTLAALFRSVCNEGAQNITPMRPDLRQLLITVRRAEFEDQLEVLAWLVRKFPYQARKIFEKE